MSKKKLEPVNFRLPHDLIEDLRNYCYWKPGAIQNQVAIHIFKAGIEQLKNSEPKMFKPKE